MNSLVETHANATFDPDSAIYPSTQAKSGDDFHVSEAVAFSPIRNSKIDGDTYAAMIGHVEVREAQLQGSASNLAEIMQSENGSLAELLCEVSKDESIVVGSLRLESYVKAALQDGIPPAGAEKQWVIRAGDDNDLWVSPQDQLPQDSLKFATDSTGVNVPRHILHNYFTNNPQLRLESSAGDETTEHFTHFKQNSVNFGVLSMLSSFTREPSEMGGPEGLYHNDRKGPVNGELTSRTWLNSSDAEAFVVERLCLPENIADAVSRDNNSDTTEMIQTWPPGCSLKAQLAVRNGFLKKAVIYSHHKFKHGHEKEGNPKSLTAKLRDAKLRYLVVIWKEQALQAWKQAKTFTYNIPETLSRSVPCAHYCFPDMSVVTEEIHGKSIMKFDINKGSSDWLPDAIIIFHAHADVMDQLRYLDSNLCLWKGPESATPAANAEQEDVVENIAIVLNGSITPDITREYLQNQFTNTKNNRLIMAQAFLGRMGIKGIPLVLKSTYDSYLQGSFTNNAEMAGADRFFPLRLQNSRKMNRYAGQFRELGTLSVQVKYKTPFPDGFHICALQLSKTDIVLNADDRFENFSVNKALSKPSLTGLVTA